MKKVLSDLIKKKKKENGEKTENQTMTEEASQSAANAGTALMAVTQPGEAALTESKSGSLAENADTSQEGAGEEEIPLEPLKRVKPSLSRGLTREQVQERIAHKAVNTPVEADSQTLKDIVKENVFTYFNPVSYTHLVLLYK